MDDNLNIRVDVQTASLTQLRDELKRLKTDISALPATSPEFKAAATQAGAMSARIKDLSYQMNGLSGAVKQARIEKRMFRFAVVELMGGLDGVSGAIDALSGKSGDGGALKNLTKSMTGALGAGMGIKFGMDMLGGTFAKLGGPIGIAVAAMTLLGGVIENERQKVIALNKALTENFELRKALGRTTADEEKLDRQRQYNAAAVQQQQSGGRRLTFNPYGLIGQGKILSYQSDKLGVVQAANEQLSVEKQITDENKKQADLAKKKYDTEMSAFMDGIRLRNSQFDYAHTQNPMQKALGQSIPGMAQPSMVGMGTGMGGVQGMSFGEVQVAKMVQDVMAENQRRANEFVNSLKGGFVQATSYLAEGLIKAFNLGDSLMSRFLGTLLGSFAQAGIGYLTGGLFSAMGLSSLVEVGATQNERMRL